MSRRKNKDMQTCNQIEIPLSPYVMKVIKLVKSRQTQIIVYVIQDSDKQKQVLIQQVILQVVKQNQGSTPHRQPAASARGY